MKKLLFLLLFLANFFSYASNLNEIVRMNSLRYGVDENLIFSIIKAESNYQQYALSPKGAMGLMQVMPKTAKRFGVYKNELYITEKNIEAGVKYLKFLKSIFGNNLHKVIAAYNAGENAVIKYGGIPPYKETREYVKKVLRILQNNDSGPILISNKSQKQNIHNKNMTMGWIRNDDGFYVEF